MRTCHLSACSTIALLLIALAAAPASAAGYWHVPSTLCQCLGLGCGPGYHAPMVLARTDNCGYLAMHGDIRLPCAPKPPYVINQTYSYGCACGCEASCVDCECGQMMNGPPADVREPDPLEPAPIDAQTAPTDEPREAFRTARERTRPSTRTPMRLPRVY